VKREKADKASDGSEGEGMGTDGPGETRLRDFRGEDTASLVQLIRTTVDACYTGVYPPRAVAFFKACHSKQKIAERARTGTVLVLERGGAPVATGSLVGNEIGGVFVAPAHQRRGYGGTVMSELEARGEAQGHTEVELSVSLPSRRFYERLGHGGFEDRSIDVGEGQRLDYWQAWKSLEDLCARRADRVP